MKILVYGAGAIGSLFGARLQEAGHEIYMLAKGDRLDEIRTFGIGLQDAISGRHRVVPVQAIEALAPDDAYDLVIVAVRAHRLAEALPALVASQNTPNILFLGHNITGTYEIVGSLGWQRPMLGFPGAVASRDRSLVYYAQTPSVMPTQLGELNGHTTNRLAIIAHVLAEAGFPVGISAAIDAWLKSHAACIAPFVAALSAANGDARQLGRTPDALLLALRGGKEAFQVLRSRGTPITPLALGAYNWLPEPLAVHAIGLALQSQMASTLLDWETGAYEDECASLLATFRSMARTAGIATPVLDNLYDFVSPPRVGLPAGSDRLPMDWTGVAVAAGALLGAAALGHLVYHRRR